MADADGRSVLVRSVANALRGGTSVDVIRLLLDAGADIEARDTDSLTPLMMAAVAGNIGLLALLILKKAAIGASDVCGVPAIEQAGIYGHREAVDLPVSFGGKRVQLPYPICTPQKCPICAGLPNRVSADKVRGEELPRAQASALEGPVQPGLPVLPNALLVQQRIRVRHPFDRRRHAGTGKIATDRTDPIFLPTASSCGSC